jgi:hypothetical protein
MTKKRYVVAAVAAASLCLGSPAWGAQPANPGSNGQGPGTCIVPGTLIRNIAQSPINPPDAFNRGPGRDMREECTPAGNNGGGR